MSAKRKKKNRRAKKPILKALFYLCFTSLTFVSIFILLVLIGVFGQVPDTTDLKSIKNSVASQVISVDRKTIGRYFYENRTNANIEDIPQHLIDALIATEDARFYKHNGIDYRSLGRVMIKSILLFNKNSGGGSTITQQLAKNLFPRKNFGIFTLPVAKVKEITLARRFEKAYSKDEILELYLNTVPFGENTFGIETASLVYFNDKPKYLNLEQSATLIGLLKANNFYNPRRNRKASARRRNTVLAQMAKYEYLTPGEADSISKIPLVIDFKPISHDVGLAPYFREFLRGKVKAIVAELEKPDGTDYNIYNDGLKIYTTINAKMQKLAEESMVQHMFRLQKSFDAHWKGMEPWKTDQKFIHNQVQKSEVYKSLRNQGHNHNEAIKILSKAKKTKIFTLSGEQDRSMSSIDSLMHHFRYLHNGFLVINGHSGDILAWVGGINYKYFKYDHVLSKRQVGSTFKPIVFANAIENGISPCDFYANDSIVYEDYDDWCPKNSHGGYGGYYSLKGALINSVNTVSVSVLMEQGFNNVINTSRKMGITSDIPAVPSMALGTSENSLLEMVYAYSTFVNKGKRVEPVYISRIEDQNGKILYEQPRSHNNDSAFSAQTAETLLAMMQQVVDKGTGQDLRSIYNIEGDLAGKTGTTDNQTDAWFIGITPVLIMGSWVGGDHQAVRFRSTAYGQGAKAAMPICGKFLNKLYKEPLYRSLPKAKFNIDSEVYANLSCEDYNENYKSDLDKAMDKFFQERNEDVRNIIRNLFNREMEQEQTDSTPKPAKKKRWLWRNRD
ncbi:MAG: transglycosylase domain-containing protein [Bacteroidales bacterium]|nr:transglycosylase domain-containing protein [Bacteroidales bacterium]